MEARSGSVTLRTGSSRRAYTSNARDDGIWPNGRAGADSERAAFGGAEGGSRTHNLLFTNWSRPRPPRSTETRRVLTGTASRPISSTCIHRTPWTGASAGRQITAWRLRADNLLQRRDNDLRPPIAVGSLSRFSRERGLVLRRDPLVPTQYVPRRATRRLRRRVAR